MMAIKTCPICCREYEDKSRNLSKVACSKACRNAMYISRPGVHSKMKMRMRRNVLVAKGVSVSEDEWARVVAEIEEDACAICGGVLSGGHIDHDHKTLRIRNVLCAGCNKGLGFYESLSPEARDKLVDYLNKWDGK